MTETAARPSPNHPARDVIQNEIDIAQKNMVSGYYFWYWIHVILGILTVALPATAAIMPLDELNVKILAGLGALCGAIYAFLKPHELASGYDYACQEVWKTDIAYNLNTIGEKEIVEQLSKVISATTFKYTGPK